MQQETAYPDPEQLRRYAADPAPFSGIVASDLDVTGDGALVARGDGVVYLFAPSKVLVESEEGKQPVGKADVDLRYRMAWNEAISVQVEEDFVCAIGMVSAHDQQTRRYDAYWTLDAVMIGPMESIGMLDDLAALVDE